jgi:hypothetical protein
MDIFQPHQGNIPEEKNKKTEDQAGDDQQSDENSFLRPMFQENPQRNNEIRDQRSEVKDLRTPMKILPHPPLSKGG